MIKDWPIQYRTLCLAMVVFAAYFPTVFNQFIGDDHLLVEYNSFYTSWKNVPRLFEPGNIHQDRDYFSDNGDYGTGCVSYRPVLSLSYFLDSAFWGHKPFGFHLTNVLLHSLNCALFYLILVFILGPSPQALLAAFLFGLHPIQSEAVAVVGYRADVLSAFFVLSSFYAWLKFRAGHYARVSYYLVSLAMYFLALFTKESTVVLPFAIFMYERICPSGEGGGKKNYWLGFIPFLVFYLYIYVFVFPNTSLFFQRMGGSVAAHVWSIAHILYIYLINFAFPWTVKLLPGQYVPPLDGFFSLETVKMAVVLAGFAGVILNAWRRDKALCFWALWFLVFFLPVSNLIPLANPMAYRFMYLPSVGILAFYAVLLYKAGESLKPYSGRLPSIFYALLLVVCLLCTMFLNDRFKNDFNVGYTMIEHYPRASTGYALMGEQYYVRGAFNTAKDYFEKALMYGYGAPQIEMQLGICYFNLGDLGKARAHVLNVLAVNPGFQPARHLLELLRGTTFNKETEKGGGG